MSVSCRRDAHSQKIARSLTERFLDENASLEAKENRVAGVVKVEEKSDGFFIEKRMRFLMIFGLNKPPKNFPKSEK